ncbi:MAG: acyl-ACP thioesterase domain-containing protein, partial [Bacteroidota bacterium]
MRGSEKDGVWTQSWVLPAFLAGPGRAASMAAMGNLFQEAAGNHAVYRALGFDHMKARGQYWVLNRLRIHMTRFPLWDEAINVQTWVSSMR